MIVPLGKRKTDWRYKVMELSKISLEEELNCWSREKLISWLNWNDPNGIWSDEESIAERYEPLTRETACSYILKLLTEV